MRDPEHDTMVRSVAGRPERRHVTAVQEWRIEQELDSKDFVLSVMRAGGEAQSLLLSSTDAQDIGDVLRRKAGAADAMTGPERKLGIALARRSVSPKRLSLPAPDPDELEALMQAGLRAPDHGGLHPWRVIEFRPQSREALARYFEAEKLRRDPLAGESDLKKAREHATRAPMLLGFVVSPRHRTKVPLREQWLCAGAALGNILGAAHQLGYGAIVLSGDRCFDPVLARQLGLAGGEILAGFISIGTIKEAPPPPRERLSQVVLSCWVDPADAGVRPIAG